MKTNLFTFAALALVVATGCSKDETLGSGADPVVQGGIGFAAYSPVNTAVKGVPVASNDAFKGIDGVSFQVLGYTEGSEYLKKNVYYLESGETNTDITSAVASDGWHYAGVKLWPNTDMDFYALYSKETLKATGSPAVSYLGLADYAVSTTITEQEDLMYAAVVDKNVSTGHTVTLPFQHALTQLNFKVGVAANYDDLNVSVSSIQICNVAASGNFNFIADQTTDTNTCGWNSFGEKTSSYSIANTTPLVKAAPSDAVDFNDTNTGHELMLIPQTFAAATTDASGNLVMESGAVKGSYLKIACKLYTDGGVYYLGSAAANGYAIIPLGSVMDISGKPNATSPQWLPGRNITYTITFGDSTSNPGGGGYDEEGKPVLKPISFDTEVEDWVDVTGSLDM